MIYGIVPKMGVFPGVSAVFQQGELEDIMKFIPLTDVEQVTPDDVAVFGAWHEGYSLIFRRMTCRKKGILWTSPLLQSEFSGLELIYIRTIKTLLDRGILDFVWCGDPDMVRVFGPKAFHAPYPLRIWSRSAADIQRGHASLFCPQSPRKNIAVQMLAAKEAGLTLHMNGSDPNLMNFAQAIGLKVVNHGWMEFDDYLNVVAGMEVGFQVSLTGVESFDYVVWDHLTQGTPILHNVPWAPDDLRSEPELRTLVPRLGQVLDRYDDTDTRGDIINWCRNFAPRQNERVKEVLERL